MSFLVNFAIGAGLVYGYYSLNNILNKVFGYDNLYLCMFIVMGGWTIVRCADYHPDCKNEEGKIDKDNS